MQPAHVALYCYLHFIHFKSALISDWTGYVRSIQGSSEELPVVLLLPRSHSHVLTFATHACPIPRKGHEHE